MNFHEAGQKSVLPSVSHFSLPWLSLCFWLGLAFVGFNIPMAAELSLNGNESHINWKTAETQHFRFHYDEDLEPVAEYIAAIAEQVAPEKLKRYNLTFSGKTEFIIRDDIFSNGWANAYQNTMNVWATDWDIPFRSTHDWLKDVITHEFSHLVSIQSGSKLAPCIHGLLIGYQDYFNEPVQASFSEVIPFTHQPNWFAEGVAQYESQISGFDSWDSHRDMLLRVAILENKLLDLGRMGVFAGTGLEYEQGPYTQGYALVRYLAERYGDAAVLDLWREQSRIHRQDFKSSMERVLGKPAQNVYEEWKSELTLKYGEQVEKLGTLQEGEKITKKSFYNYYPRWTKDNEKLLFISNRSKQTFRSNLYEYNLSDTVKKEEDRWKLISGSIGDFYSVAPDESTFVFSSARNKDENGRKKRDIYSQNFRKKDPLISIPFKDDPSLKRYTKNLNATHSSFNSSGDEIVFVRAELSNFYLCSIKATDAKKPDLDAVKTLWPKPEALKGHYGFNVYTPRYSPDGNQIAFSYFDGQSRKIGLIDKDGENFQALLNRPFDDRDPEWSPDGKSLYFSSDSTGIYNIYRITLDNSEIEGITNVVGGAFAPAINWDGNKLAFVNYDKDGFSINILDSIASIPNQRVSVTRNPAGPSPEPLSFSGNNKPYYPLPNRYLISPLIFGQEMSARTRDAKTGDAKWLGGASVYLNDPVNKNEVSAGLLLEVGNGTDYLTPDGTILKPNKESEFFVGLSNHSLPITLGLSYGRRNIGTQDSVVERPQDFLDPPPKPTFTHYALTLHSIDFSVGYDLFDATTISDWDKSSFFQLSSGYSWNDFNFYELPFAFTYYQNLYLQGGAVVFMPGNGAKQAAAPTGLALVSNLSLSRSLLIRQGTFQETFDFSNGYPSEKYRNYRLSELDAGGSYGLAIPGIKKSSLVLSGFVGSILSWKYLNSTPLTDTLDSFFERGLYLRGYPLLRDIENLSFSGENTLQFSLDAQIPIWNDIFTSWWIVFVDDLYAHAFADAGRAWNGKLNETKLIDPKYWDPEKNRDAYYKSIGLGLRLHSRVYQNYPFIVYLEGSQALDRVPSDSLGNLAKIAPIKLAVLGEIPLTRIDFGFTLGLGSGLFGRQPRNVSSPQRQNGLATLAQQFNAQLQNKPGMK